MASCQGEKLTVKRLSDGAILTAWDELGRDFKVGDTICIEDVSSVYGPDVVSDRYWADTIVTYTSYYPDTSFYVWSYYMAVVRYK